MGRWHRIWDDAEDYYFSGSATSLDEADAFPPGSDDDQVDAVSGAFREFMRQGEG